MIQSIEGGVCAPIGFKACGIRCGVRASSTKRDLAIIASDVPAAAAAVYTTNLVQGAPIAVTRAHLANGRARAIVCNSGNANTCNADGIEIAEGMASLTAQALGIASDDVLVASTGVIGQRLSLDPFRTGIPQCAAGLSREGTASACEAIMTTDTIPKSVAVEFTLGGKTCRLGGIAKGSGMIHPNLATMLVFLTTDAAIAPNLLQTALSSDVQATFNMTSVDGDTSTNDTVILMANGLAGNPTITSADDPDFAAFMTALNSVTLALCRTIAGDGEGATKLLECCVSGARDVATARIVAKSVICSSLLKAAMFGADANWGRVLCAIGYSGAAVDVSRVGVAFRSAKGTLPVCERGAGIPFSEEVAKEILLEKEIEILITLDEGDASAKAWGCDLTYDYVKINGDYRS